MGGKDERR